MITRRGFLKVLSAAFGSAALPASALSAIEPPVQPPIVDEPASTWRAPDRNWITVNREPLAVRSMSVESRVPTTIDVTTLHDTTATTCCLPSEATFIMEVVGAIPESLFVSMESGSPVDIAASFGRAVWNAKGNVTSLSQGLAPGGFGGSITIAISESAWGV